MLPGGAARQHLKKVTKNFFCDFFEYLYYDIKMMRKLSILIILLSLWACSNKEGEPGPGGNAERVEITPFKINKVLLRDTELVKTVYMLTDSGRMSITDYQYNWDKDYKFLDYTGFTALRQAVWALVRNPGSKVYVNPMGNASTPSEVKERVIQCAMIEESSFDKNGDETIQSKYMCDSVTTIRNINQIRFFESWYFNSATNMIERELLGYSVHEYVPDKMAFRELFDVFVNEKALEKARKYYFNKQAQ